MSCFIRSYLDSGTATDEINSTIHAGLRQAGIRMSTDVVLVRTLTAEAQRAAEDRKESQ